MSSFKLDVDLRTAPNQSAKDVSMIGFFIVCGVLFAIIAACWNA